MRPKKNPSYVQNVHVKHSLQIENSIKFPVKIYSGHH